MNISPTPRRYTSRSNDGNGLSYSNGDQAYIYSDVAGTGINGERIIPEEYKLNSQMINRLIKQNKELITKLDGKQEEIDRLNVLVGSLRGKLIKYTEMNKKLQDRLGMPIGSRSSSEGITENENDYIQVPKRRGNPEQHKETVAMANDDRISALSAKLDKLTNLVLETGAISPSQHSQTSQGAPVAQSASNALFEKPSARPSVNLASPSEEDIMCRESVELKQMEDQIDSLKRKLLIKRENELRKISLNQELLELMDKLSMQSPAETKTKTALHPHTHVHTQTHTKLHPDHCVECHYSNENPPLRPDNDVLKADVPMANPLETPTPLQRRPQPASINQVW